MNFWTKMQRLAWIPLLICAIALANISNPRNDAVAGEIQSRVAKQPIHQGDFTNMQCMSCHRMKADFSHPVNIQIKAGLNPRLPLVNGKITCATCHDTGIDAHRLARTNGQSLLRTENTVVLCAQCHDSMDGTRASQHAIAIGKAHLQSVSKSTQSSRNGGLVRETQNCLTCHDGLVSSDVAMSSPSTLSDAMSDHPVNVVYRSRHEGAAEVLMKPASGLNPAIRLFEGRVGCGSCHSPYSTQDDLLVMSNNRSQLCFSCHNE